MKRLLQLIGIRKWSGEDLVSLQAEPMKTIDAFFATYGNCIFNGCEVSAAPGNTYNIAPGFVALQGKDQDNRDTFKVAPFAGLENATLPVYLTLSYNVIEKEYVDGKVKPVAYDYYAAATSVRPADETPYLEITASGGRCFADAIGITQKLDKTGNGRDVTVTFNTAADRTNVQTGDKLTIILGKVARWFSDLKAVAFSGKTADLTADADHRFTTDTEKVGWNDKYTKTETDNKDAATLTAAKNYTDALGGNVYKKTETYTRAETDAKVATLGNEVYRKGETYTRSETDAKDTAVLNTAKQYVLDRIAEIVGGSPAALDTLYEIAKALGNDPSFATSIMALVNGKAPLVHTHTKGQITDFPTSMPASDVYSWAKQPTKPAYNAGEVGAAPVSHNHAGTYAPVSHDHDTIKGNYTGSGGQQPPSYVPSGKVRFNMMNTPINGDGSYKDFLMMDTYAGSDVPVTTAFGISKSEALRAFIMQGIKGGTAWNRVAEIYTTANFNPSNYATAGHNHNGVYQPAGSYAPSNHNHDGTYQPTGNYAPATHSHTADQISDTSSKVMMTAAERLKLAGIGTLSKGMIIMWSGTVNTIPSGWHLCDGTNGTPNLMDRFIVGAGATYSPGATGGSNSVSLTIAQLPSHSHIISTNGGHSHTLKSGVYGNSLLVFPSNNQGGGNINDVRTTYQTSTVGSHSHTANSTGGNSSHENRPPYYALAFIMKL